MTSKSAQGLPAMLFTAFAILTMGAVLLLNLQPWFVLGQDFTSQIDTGPLLGLADWMIGGTAATVAGLIFCFLAIKNSKRKLWSALFAICGLILLMRPATLIQVLGELVGFLMWGWIQFVQVSPMLVEHSLLTVNKKWLTELRRYRVLAYLVEMVACFIKYPPYAGGDLSRLLLDLQAFSPDASLWSWSNFGWAAGTMLAVEVVFNFILKAAVYSGAFSKPSQKSNSNSGQKSKSRERPAAA